MRKGRASVLGLAIAGACAAPAPAIALRAADVLPTAKQLPGFTRHHAAGRAWQHARAASSAQALYRDRKRARITIRVAVARSAAGAARMQRAARRSGSTVRAGLVVAQIAVKGPQRVNGARIVARLVGARARAAAARTPWMDFVAHAEADGRITPREAVRAFSSAVVRLPGVRAHAVGGPIPDGTIAVRWLLGALDRISPTQRAAALAALNGGRAARAAAFVPSLIYQQQADMQATAIGLKLGITLDLPMVVGIGPVNKPAALAMTMGVDVNGQLVTANPTTKALSAPLLACRVSVGPKGQVLFGDKLDEMLAHEVFHCFQIQFAGAAKFDLDTGPDWDWLYEGSAESVGCDIVPAAGDAVGWYQVYLEDPGSSLFSRDYGDMGFFQHVQEEGNDLWGGRWPLLFQQPDKMATYDLLVAPEEAKIWATYAPGFVRDPGRGPAWDAKGACIPGAKAPIGYLTVYKGLGPRHVAVDEYSGNIWELASDTGALVVGVEKGFGRLSGAGGTPDAQLGSGAYCVRPGGCACPDGLGGSTELPQAVAPYLALSAAKGGGSAEVSALPIDELCDRTGHPPGGGGGGGGGYSNGDPHLRTFDGLPYDFQAAGEFVLARSGDGAFEVQSRQVPYDGLKTVSVNGAIALRAGGHRVGVYLTKTATPQTLVDGHPVDPAAVPADLGGGVRLRGGSLGITVDWPDGSRVTVRSASIWGLIVTVAPGAALRGRLAGLLGDFDGNRGNDLHARGSAGTVNPARFRALYGAFERSWLVRRGASLFDYGRGKTTGSYYRRGFPRRPPKLPGSRRRAGLATCRSAGVTDAALLTGCALDVGITGKRDFATGTAALQQTLADNAQRATATPWQSLTSVALDGFGNMPALQALAPDRALLAWAQRTNPGELPEKYALQSLDFTSSPAAAAADIHPATIISDWAALDLSPALWQPAPGTTAIIWAGDHALDINDQLWNRTDIATRQPDGSWTGPTVVMPGDYSDPSAIALQGGEPFFVRTVAGSGALPSFRGIDPSQTPQDLLDNGAPATGPQLVRDGAGAMWLAWRAPVSNEKTGVWMRPLDPATGLPTGPSMMAPGSEQGGDLIADRVVVACSPTGPGCRVAYPSSDGAAIQTWAPGEPAPVTVATGVSHPLELRAAYAADGGLWLAWENHANDDQSWRVVHGDANGAGAVRVLDNPPTQFDHVDIGHTALLPLNGGLLIVANLAADGPHALWATFVSG